jgi:hypothetical protein
VVAESFSDVTFRLEHYLGVLIVERAWHGEPQFILGLSNP